MLILLRQKAIFILKLKKTVVSNLRELHALVQ